MRFPLKSYVSKVSFEIGNNPVIEKKDNWQEYVPENFKAVLDISSDFELAWAYRYNKLETNPLEDSLQKARLSRINVPNILALCDQFKIPVTWATVGHLFLDSCHKNDGLPHPEIKRIGHFESPYWKFSEGDWFKDDPCSNIQEHPEWYGKDLIDAILASKVKHEIGSHTFSHIDCRDSVCPPDVFLSEIDACRKVANARGIELKSFVFPGHTFGNTNLLKKCGFTNYRVNFKNALGYPYRQEDGIWIHKSTSEFDIRPNWSIDYHIYRYKKMVDRAIKYHNNCHFWFHPSMPAEFVEKVLPPLFEHIFERRQDIFITTMGEYTDWLNNKQQQ